MVYRISVDSGTWTPVAMRPGSTTLDNKEINSLEVSEDGKEMMISTTQRIQYHEFDGAAACFGETLEWISIDQSQSAAVPAGTVLKTISVPQGASCGGWVEAGGTVAASRVDAGPVLLKDALKASPTRSGPKRRYVRLRELQARARATPR